VRQRLDYDTQTALTMTAPAMAGLLLFVGAPFVLAAILSITNLRLGSPLPLRYVGVQHYREILGDASFRQALLNNAVFALVVVPVQTALALAVALLLNRSLRGMTVFRTMFFMPVVFPMAMVAVVWELIYAPGPTGLLNSVLSAVSFGAWRPQDFLHEPAFALPAIMALSIWQGMGFQMVVLLAGLQSIPRQLYEAASIDGARSVRQFFHVTLPGLRNPLIFVIMVTAILAFRVFDQVQILTQGGPLKATTTVIYEAYTTAFGRLQVGRACAITVVFFLLVLVITVVARALMRQQGEIR